MLMTTMAISLSMAIDDPRPRSQQPPQYPYTLQNYDLEADCSVRFDIDGVGYTTNVNVRQCRVSRIHPTIAQDMTDQEIRDVERRADREFANASQDAVRRWRYDNPDASTVYDQHVEFRYTRYRVTMRTR